MSVLLVAALLMVAAMYTLLEHTMEHKWIEDAISNLLK